MGNAVFCRVDKEAGAECNTNRPSSQQRLLAKCPRHQTTLKPHPRDEAKVVWGTTPAHAYGRGGRSPEQQQQRQNGLSSFTGISPVELSSMSSSIPLIPELERASATPQLEWLQSSLPPSVSDPNLEPPHEYTVDFGTVLSDARPDRIAAAPHADGSTESSSRSSYFTPSISGLEMPPDLGFAANLERVASPELRAPPSDSPTPVHPPLLSASPVESLQWDDVVLPAAALPVTVVNPTVPVAPSPYLPFARNASTGTKKLTGNWCSSDSKSASRRRGVTKTQKESMCGSPANPTQPQQHRRPLRQVAPLQSVQEVKPTDAVTSSAAHTGSKGHPPDTLPRRRLTDKSGASDLMPPPLESAGALGAKAAAKAAYTGNSPIAGSHRSQLPLLPKHLPRYGEKALTGGDANGAETANSRGGAQSRASPRNALVARKMDEESGAATPPSGAPALPPPPDDNVSSLQGCTEQGFARLPLLKETRTSVTAMKPTQAQSTRQTTQSATNGDVRNNSASYEPSWRLTSDEDDTIPQLKFTARGEAAPSSPMRTKWQTATAATTANQNRASTFSAPISDEALPHSALRGTMKLESLTLSEGGVRQDAASTTHLQVSAQHENAPSRLHAANCMGVRMTEKTQDSLLSGPAPSSPSLFQQVGAAPQSCSRSDDGSESPSEDKERPSGDGECLPRPQNVCDLTPNLGASHRVNSILKKTSSYRSLNGSPVERALPAVGSVSFLLCEQEASLALVSRQGVFKAVSHHAKPRQREDHRLFQDA
ncbi:hypothetical protein, unknown function [Leishmania mexicana MHOM/GT/2001/U1103]|uniref:Uncharacterized protein n=1 Tax=Leishmania mexicana (strain MHOM/GT/2001/U1103) TaxID=929439 RepID=E9B219_LEIMU|nr:hypothetical protein, unknown function [Leishmania mexicana MHOM/GT/2001/U1103]CBZ29276.1 hypothetical protein, unknown function [Leishmania mexicana MHOM/GT/2001/U1103]